MQPLLNVMQTIDMSDVVAWAAMILGLALAALLLTVRSGRGSKVSPATDITRLVAVPPLAADCPWNRVADIVDSGVANVDVVAATHVRAGRQLDAADYALGRLKADYTQVMMPQREGVQDPAHGVAPPLCNPPAAA
jgi:hypothetical protein